MEQFKDLGLSDNALKALKKKGFTEPTSVQVQVIPLLLKGEKDIIGQSQTGTGKTASFALPILEKIKEKSKFVQAIILTPTRELALQVSQEINSLKGNKNVEVIAVYGGTPIYPQIDQLRKGVDIVVGTPGRIMDLQERGSLRLDNIKYAVLDEADEMLNMGFVEDIEDILKNTPEDKNMLLFSATMPRPILKIAQRYMREYEFVEIEKEHITVKTVEQVYYEINAKDRVEAIRRIIDFYIDFHGIIFCNTKASVDTLTQNLTKLNYSAAALHGDYNQNQREKILMQFRNKHIKILVATDVAARGIDVNDLSHVINFSLPQSPEIYAHRIGRTGRAGKKGISITFVIPSERNRLKFVERINNCKLEKRVLPTPEDIVKNKENQIKTIIKEILEKSKSSKYASMAKDLLEGNSPEEVVSAILKYSFKNELDSNTYKEISDYETRGSSGSSRRRGSFRGNRGRFGRSNDRGNRGRFSGRSRSSGRSNDRRSDGRSSGRSDSRGSRSEGKTYSNKRRVNRNSR